ncbi:unnamed protein product [Urochloa decumbens]|uniref:LOB domain-containing protein n=1 Tax=Urochloa decumbens TaxID=240449 RepID=A0ABC9D6Q3_9POAL
MSAPPAPPQGPPTWSSPSGGAIASEPDSPSGATSSSPASAAPGGSSISSSSTPPTPPAAHGVRAAPPPQTTPPPGCAACKHKRQKCAPGCVLAPYFPAGNPEKFRSVLRVFGVKNVLRTLREVPPPRWDACVRTVVHESRMRLADPVRGCVGLVEDLEAQLLDTAVELEVLRRRLEAYRQAAARRRGGGGGGLRIFQTPNPSHGRAAAAAASPWGGITNLGAAWQQSGTGRARGGGMRPQGGPYGAAWSPATAPGLAAMPPPQLYAMQPQFSARPPQLSPTPMQLFPAMQPQHRRQAATRGATAMVHDGFGDDAWANGGGGGERGGPNDM